MKFLSKLIFGAVALCAATFATAASAKADDFGVFIGTNGFGVQYSNYDRGYYGYAPVYHGTYGYNRGYDRCRDRWYRRHHRHCRSYGGYGHYGSYYYPGYYGYGYYPQHRRHYRGHWYPRHQWRGNWGHHDGWRNGRHGHGHWRGGHGRHGGH